jgi:MFS family permease
VSVFDQALPDGAPATGPTGITGWLERAPTALFCAFAGLASFAAYFAMYAFRKPIAAASYDHVAGWAFTLDYKSALIIAQTLGYALSKLVGVRLIAEFGQNRRAISIVGLIVISWLSLVAFALIPSPWNVAALFFNGLPLGLIWGLVFSYLEGRRTSEVLGAILCSSFVLSSGAVKSVGRLLIDHLSVDPFWMPAATGAVFFPLLLVAVLGLSALPAPNAADIAQRSPRAPMDRAQRRNFVMRHWPALVPLVAAYVLQTAFRDFRDNFAAEIWRALGYHDVAALFTGSELPIAAVTLAVISALIAVRDNLKALMLVHGMIFFGAALLAGSTLAQTLGWIDPVTWMVLSGAGLYMAYIPYNAVLFDRMIAVTRDVGNVGFLIYLSDASGYAGSIGLMLLRDFGSLHPDWLGFFRSTAYLTAAACAICAVLSARHFLKMRPPAEPQSTAVRPS